MKDINLNELQDIQIPEGLEERLSAKIDFWEQEEMQEAAQPKAKVISVRWWHYVAVAASVVLVAGAAVLLAGIDDDIPAVAKADVETPVEKSTVNAAVVSGDMLFSNETKDAADHKVPAANSRPAAVSHAKPATRVEADIPTKQENIADNSSASNDFRNHIVMQNAVLLQQMAETNSHLAEFANLLQDAFENCEASRAAMQSDLQNASLMQGMLY